MMKKLGLLTAAGAAAGYMLVASSSQYMPGQCTATDGDTLRCGEERIRLAEIDAPELPGHCRRGRVCVVGDPYASKAGLQRLIAGRVVRVRRLSTDRYGRTVADVRVRRVSASCYQIQSGYAVQQLKWGDHGVTRACPG